MTLRRLATGLSYRQKHDMARMAVEPQRQAFMLTLKAIHRHFGPMYLNRMPTECELRATTKQYEARGFTGCMGAVDCMHFHWKTVPFRLKGSTTTPRTENVRLLAVGTMRQLFVLLALVRRKVWNELRYHRSSP